jgi:hypothetical protein
VVIQHCNSPGKGLGRRDACRNGPLSKSAPRNGASPPVLSTASPATRRAWGQSTVAVRSELRPPHRPVDASPIAHCRRELTCIPSIINPSTIARPGWDVDVCTGISLCARARPLWCGVVWWVRTVLPPAYPPAETAVPRPPQFVLPPSHPFPSTPSCLATLSGAPRFRFCHAGPRPVHMNSFTSPRRPTSALSFGLSIHSFTSTTWTSRPKPSVDELNLRTNSWICISRNRLFFDTQPNRGHTSVTV